MIGRALQTKVVGTQDGPIYRIVNDLVTFKAVAADTNGAYSLFEAYTEPGQGMPPHRQRYEDAAFWVLEGMYTFLLDNRKVMLGVGAYAYVPRGTVHAYTNSGGGPARMLVLVTPGGIHERFFAEVGKCIADRDAAPLPSDPPDLSRLLGIARNYGIEILPPTT